jgi:hypothetical protein
MGIIALHKQNRRKRMTYFYLSILAYIAATLVSYMAILYFFVRFKIELTRGEVDEGDRFVLLMMSFFWPFLIVMGLIALIVMPINKLVIRMAEKPESKVKKKESYLNKDSFMNSFNRIKGRE